MLRASFTLLALALSLGPSAARAQIAIAAFAGRDGPSARQVVLRELSERGLDVVGVDAEPVDDASAREAAASVSARFVVGGRVDVRRRRWEADLWVRGADGAERARVRSRGRAAVLDALERALRALSGAVTAAPEPTGAAEPAAAPPRPAPDEAASSEERAAAPSPAAPAPVRARVQVGAGMRSRAIELLAPDGVNAAYRAEPYFELSASGAVRTLDVIFVRAAFGSSVALSSEREDPRLEPLSTWFAWASADAGASVVIDGTVELGAGIGAGWERYELAFNEIVPTAEYVHLRPLVILAVRIAGRALVLDAEAGLRVPFGIGDLASVYGVEHSALGADGTLRLHGVIDPGFAWALEAGVRRYWLTIERPDGRVTGTDGGWHATGWVGWEL